MINLKKEPKIKLEFTIQELNKIIMGLNHLSHSKCDLSERLETKLEKIKDKIWRMERSRN